MRAGALCVGFGVSQGGLADQVKTNLLQVPVEVAYDPSFEILARRIHFHRIPHRHASPSEIYFAKSITASNMIQNDGTGRHRFETSAAADQLAQH